VNRRRWGLAETSGFGMGAAVAALFSTQWCLRMCIALAATTAASLGGLLFAYYFDFSIGPAVAIFLGAVLVVASLLAKFARASHLTSPNEERLVSGGDQVA